MVRYGGDDEKDKFRSTQANMSENFGSIGLELKLYCISVNDKGSSIKDVKDILTIFEFLTSFLGFLVPRIESWTPGQLLWTTPKKKKFTLRNYLFIKTYLSIQLSKTVLFNPIVHYATTILLTL